MSAVSRDIMHETLAMARAVNIHDEAGLEFFAEKQINLAEPLMASLYIINALVRQLARQTDIPESEVWNALVETVDRNP